MKKVLLFGLLFSITNLFASYNNVYTCTNKDWNSMMGFDFILVQNSIYSGLNLQDENSTIRLISHSAGNWDVTSIRSIDGLSYNSKHLELKALKEEGDNQYDVTVNLSSRKSLQNSDKIHGTLEVKRLVINGMTYSASGLVERITCRKQF